MSNIILSVLGSALVIVSIYSYRHSSYTSLPVWTNFIFSGIGFILILLGIFGYYAALKSRKTMILVFTVILILAALMILAGGIGYIKFSKEVTTYLKEDWG